LIIRKETKKKKKNININFEATPIFLSVFSSEGRKERGLGYDFGIVLQAWNELFPGRFAMLTEERQAAPSPLRLRWLVTFSLVCLFMEIPPT
jgi:hypothetical protein